jgi:hypothetical protein
VDDDQRARPRKKYHLDESWPHPRSDMSSPRVFQSQTLFGAKMPAHRHGITDERDPLLSVGYHPSVDGS